MHTQAEKSIITVREQHIEKINKAIDALIDLEDYYPLPEKISAALYELNGMRNVAEEEIEAGDKIWDTKNKEFGRVDSVGVLNFIFTMRKPTAGSIGKKFCFKVPYWQDA